MQYIQTINSEKPVKIIKDNFDINSNKPIKISKDLPKNIMSISISSLIVIEQTGLQIANPIPFTSRKM